MITLSALPLAQWLKVVSFSLQPMAARSCHPQWALIRNGALIRRWDFDQIWLLELKFWIIIIYKMVFLCNSNVTSLIPKYGALFYRCGTFPRYPGPHPDIIPNFHFLVIFSETIKDIKAKFLRLSIDLLGCQCANQWKNFSVQFLL